MGQTTQGLPNDGKTGRYAISYESSLPAASGLSLAQELMDTCDQDFDLMAGWFAGTHFEFSSPVNVQLENAAGGPVGPIRRTYPCLSGITRPCRSRP